MALKSLTYALKSLAYRAKKEVLEETRKGIAIYDANPARFHDWQFTTMMEAKTMREGDMPKTVEKIVDGSRGDALACARSIGVETLCEESGIDLPKEMDNTVALSDAI